MLQHLLGQTIQNPGAGGAFNNHHSGVSDPGPLIAADDGRFRPVFKNFTHVYGTRIPTSSVVREGLQLALIVSAVTVSFDHQPDSSQSYLGSLDVGLPTLGWTVGVSVRDCLNEVN